MWKLIPRGIVCHVESCRMHPWMAMKSSNGIKTMFWNHKSELFCVLFWPRFSKFSFQEAGVCNALWPQHAVFLFSFCAAWETRKQTLLSKMLRCPTLILIFRMFIPISYVFLCWNSPGNEIVECFNALAILYKSKGYFKSSESCYISPKT